MNKLILCYSFTGSSRRFAEKLRAENGADLIEVKEVKERSKLGAYLVGCPQALGFKKVPIEDLPDLSSYDAVTLVFPVWAGNPAPAFNSAIEKLPKGCDVSLYLVSGGGETKAKTKEQLKILLKGAGAANVSVTDVSSSTAKK